MDKFLSAGIMLLSLMSAVPAISSAEPTTPVGSVNCDTSLPDRLCRLTWDIPGNALGSHWVEQMDPESSAWQRAPKRLSTSSGVSKEPVDGGHLYRVVTCRDPASKTACVSSSVVWAIFKPESADAIPERVDDKRGTPQIVFKNATLKAQQQQYNLYLLLRLLNGISAADMSAMPPMTSPRFGKDVPLEVVIKARPTNDEFIRYQVVRMYEARRAGGPSI